MKLTTLKTLAPTILTVGLTTWASAASAIPLLMHGWGGSNTDLYQFETSTSTEIVIGSTGISNMGSMAMSAAGVLYGMSTSNQLYTIDTLSAAATLVGVGSATSTPEGMTFGLDGTTLYTSGGGSLFSVDTATGASTNLGSIGMRDIDGLTVAPTSVNTAAGTFAAGTLFGTDTNTLFAIDVVTLATTIIGGVQANEALSFDSDGNLYGHNFWGDLYSIDPLAMTSSLIGSTSARITALTGFGLTGNTTTAAVPAPATLALFGLGFAALGWSRRKA